MKILCLALGALFSFASVAGNLDLVCDGSDALTGKAMGLEVQFADGNRSILVSKFGAEIPYPPRAYQLTDSKVDHCSEVEGEIYVLSSKLRLEAPSQKSEVQVMSFQVDCEKPLRFVGLCRRHR